MGAPGWYPDPNGEGQRYFDGTKWGPHAPTDKPPPPPRAAAEPRFTIHYGFAVLAFFSLLGTLIPAIIMMSSSDPKGIGAGMGVLWMLWGGVWTLIWAAFAVQHTLRGRRR